VALLVVRTEHEVVDDELAAPVEQIEQTRRPSGAFEDVIRVDLDHGEFAASRTDRVLHMSGFPLFLE
jgi:hypothetical protein